MPTLYLMRHGRAAAAWDADPDPGLDDIGKRQAEAAAEALAPTGPLQLIVSPLTRTRETAAPLATLWQTQPRIEPRISEIPSPSDDLHTRGQWLREVMGRSWPELDAPLRQWRQQLLNALTECQHDTVAVTHFIAINAAVGAAVGDSRVVNWEPDHCSVTVLRVDGQGLELLERGRQGSTRVL